VRLLLDAHVSGGRVGRPLSELGHDVRPLDQEPELEGPPDLELLELATADERVLVTHNVADFPTILRNWAEAGRSHGGVILVYGIDHREFSLIVRGIDRWCAFRPRQRDWLGLSVILDRTFASGR